jgi:hypothetical protein
MSTDRFAFAADNLIASFNASRSARAWKAAIASPPPYGDFTPFAAVQPQSFRTPSYSDTATNGGGSALYNAHTANPRSFKLNNDPRRPIEAKTADVTVENIGYCALGWPPCCSRPEPRCASAACSAIWWWGRAPPSAAMR